ncbi:hypothetical protein [Chryseobacterium sp. 22458]|uniref:hypothetical protein n=1 Tax=Chryseobacterium sp. 22458 TaxID=3453921 RepID=UPI003F877FC8
MSWKKEAGCYYSSDGNTQNAYSLRVSQLPAFITRFQTCLKTGSFYPEFTLL